MSAASSSSTSIEEIDGVTTEKEMGGSTTSRTETKELDERPTTSLGELLD